MRNDEELGRELEFLLRSEADTVQPVGDGLQQIRTKIERRRARRLWVVPVSALAGTAAVATIAYAVFGGTDPNRLNQAAVTSTPTVTSSVTQTSTPTPSGSPTSVPEPGADTTLAMWPWATQADVTRSADSDMDPRLMAQDFVKTFGGILGSDVTAEAPTTIDGEIVVPVSRKIDNGSTVEVAVVHLHRWTHGALSVTSVSAGARGFTTLQPGAVLASDDEVRGIRHGEEIYQVSVYAAGDKASIGKGRSDTAKQPEEWVTRVKLAKQTAASGFVVATEDSMADGGLGAMIAVPVRFETNGDAPTPSPTAASPSPTSASPTPTETAAGGLPGYMTTFVGVKNGRIALFGTASGAFKSYLTNQTAGGGDSSPSMSPDRDWVYFIRGGGTCANSIARVPFPGGSESQVELVGNANIGGFVYASMSAGPSTRTRRRSPFRPVRRRSSARLGFRRTESRSRCSSRQA